ncbi:Transposase [Variovorax sp. HW608]|uniref:IS630 family transposase n=1 Tax=Variovorax sp. HW608 TaxID=1034889 RepID=UPI00081FED4B|nr:IS630 family transposase [Variovorax sp. HW608]SCK55397.1 Transposase [Variovorax sp. HW608]SCK60238.1 Transposase [Variovorax sp. HW608]
MGRGRRAQPIKLSREERKSLEALTRRATAEQRHVMRAQIALRAHRGETTASIAQALGVSAQTVSHWRSRLARKGVQGLQEVPRPGRPRRIGETQRLELLALACEPAEPHGRATPTLDELVDRAVQRGVVQQISRSHLQRILQAGDLRPHRVRQWLHSPDPQFREKVNEICALYRRAPKGSVVLSIDEKTGIQAIERKHADREPRPGRARRREFEYIRHGTQALIAALDVHTGRVIGSCSDRRTQADLLAFMEQVAMAYPKGRIHIVWDNLNTHRAQAVWDDFNARHDQRFVFHFTPLHASWVNQIELLFGIYSRRVLRHASHTSIGHLRQRTEAFLAQRNRAPKPFSWTFAGFELQIGEPLRFNNDANPRRPKKGR